MTDHDLHAGDGPRADRPKRWTFTAAYKLRMIEEYDAAKPGEKGALLRREGLYESSISLWCRQRDSGRLTASGAAPSARKHKSPEQAELERLRKENERLAARTSGWKRNCSRPKPLWRSWGNGTRSWG